MTPRSAQRTRIEILRVLSEISEPLGARNLADDLSRRGYDIKERAVRYHLEMLDDAGLSRKHGYSGRTITELGLRELEDALVEDRLDMVITHVEEMVYRTTFDPVSGSGELVVNLMVLDKTYSDRALSIMGAVCSEGYAAGRMVRVLDEGERLNEITIPEGYVGISTICSFSIDGVLLKRGIPADIKYSGILEVVNSAADRFVELIEYGGTSISPMKLFLARRMISVNSVLNTGNGRVLANYREIPLAALELCDEAISRLQSAGITGVVSLSPAEMVLGIPVGEDKVGIPVYSGVNGAAAVIEQGMEADIRVMAGMMKYEDMKRL